MNKQIDIEKLAKAVSLIERLKEIPEHVSLNIESPNSLGFDRWYIPIGTLCHEAAETLAALRQRVAELEAALRTCELTLSDLQGASQDGTRVRAAWQQARNALTKATP